VGLNKVVAQWSIGNLNDPVVLVAVSLVLFVVTMMSAAIPANRAASIQPADATSDRLNKSPAPIEWRADGVCEGARGRAVPESVRLGLSPSDLTSLRHALQALNLPQPAVQLVPTGENAAHHLKISRIQPVPGAARGDRKQ
jgi:hypothetical protein